MAHGYAVEGSHTTDTETILGLYGAGVVTIRPSVYYIMVGSETNSADSTNVMHVKFFTAWAPSGGAAVTPLALEQGDRAPLASAYQASTVDPTYTSAVPLLAICLNQKLTFQWYAREGGELIGNNADDSGIGNEIITTQGTSVLSTTFHFTE